VATEVQIALQLQAGQDPAAALTAAAAKLARQSLELLVQQAGQPLTGRIVPPPPNFPPGLAQIAVADMILTLKLSTPLPPGTPVRIDVQQGANGQPAVVVQPAPAGSPQVPVPAPAVQTATPVPMPAAPQATPAQQPQVSRQPAPAQIAVQLQPAPAPAVASPPQPPAQTQTPLPSVPAPTAQTPAPPVTVSVPQAAQTSPPAPTQQTVTTAPQPAPAPTAARVTAAAPPPAPTVAPLTPPATSVLPQAAAPVVAAPMQPAPPQGQPAPTPQSPTPAPVATTTQPQAQTPASPQQSMPTANPAAPPSPQPQTPATPQVLMQRLTQAFSPPANPAPAAPPAPGTPAQLVMAATTQAAAQQQSAAPLLQTLAATLLHLPPPVAEAAARVLAGRINLDRGAPSGEALKAAVLKSGVFLDAPAKAGPQPDIRQALGQLRGTLLAWLGDDIAPVAAITRRPAPPPPARGSVPRGQAPELPPAIEGNAREAGKSLLSQTDGALSRIKLMQLSTQPMDARPAAMATPSEWNLELPMMLGHELAMAQIQIGRDGRAKADAKDKSWRLRFALKFSLLGEVGAQVAMVGTRVSVAIWADEEATAETLEAMMPELAPALTAKGLDLISLTVRRGVPKDEAVRAGRLMDSMT